MGPRSPRVPRYLLEHARRRQEHAEWKAVQEAQSPPARRRAPSPRGRSPSRGKGASGSKKKGEEIDALFAGLFDDDFFRHPSQAGDKSDAKGAHNRPSSAGSRGSHESRGGSPKRPTSAKAKASKSPTQNEGGAVHLDSRPASRARSHSGRESQSDSESDAERTHARAIAAASPTVRRKGDRRTRFSDDEESADVDQKLSNVLRTVRDATGHLSHDRLPRGGSARRSRSPTFRDEVRGVRLYAFRNGAADQGGIAITAKSHKEFLEEARLRFETNADVRRVFLLDGREVGNVCKLRTDTEVLISLGEDFHGPTSIVVESVTGVGRKSGSRPHTRRRRMPLTKEVTSVVRRLANRKRPRIIVLPNGRSDESRLTVARHGVEQFLSECTDKLGLSKPARWLFAFDGIEVEDPSDPCPAEEDVWTGIIGGRPLWVSCGEPFDPAGPRGLLRSAIMSLKERRSVLQVSATAADDEDDADTIEQSLAEIDKALEALEALFARIPKSRAIEPAEMIPEIPANSRVLSSKRTVRLYVRRDGDSTPVKPPSEQTRPKTPTAKDAQKSKAAKKAIGGDVVDGSGGVVKQAPPRPRGTPVMVELSQGPTERDNDERPRQAILAGIESHRKNLLRTVVDACDRALSLGGRAKRIFDGQSSAEIKDAWNELRNDMEVVVSTGEALKTVQVRVVGISNYTTVEVPFPSKPPPPPRKGQTASSNASRESGGAPSVCYIGTGQRREGERGNEKQRWLFRQDGAIASTPDPNVFLCGFRKGPKAYVPVAIHRNELLRLSNPDMTWQWEFTPDSTLRLVRQDETVVLTIGETGGDDFGAQFAGDVPLTIEAPRPNDPRQRWAIKPDDPDISANLLAASKRARERSRGPFDSDDYIVNVRPSPQWEKQGFVWPRHPCGDPICNAGFDIVGTLVANAPVMLAKGGEASTSRPTSAMAAPTGIPVLVTRPGDPASKGVTVIARLPVTKDADADGEDDDSSDSDDSSDYGFSYRQATREHGQAKPESPGAAARSKAAMNAFLDACTRGLSLPSAARKLFLPNGEEVTSLSQLTRNMHVVVSTSGDPALVRAVRPRPTKSHAFARRKTEADLVRRYFDALDELNGTVCLEGSPGGHVTVVSGENAYSDYSRRDSRHAQVRSDAQRWSFDGDRIVCRDAPGLVLCATGARPKSGATVALCKPANATDGAWTWDNSRLVCTANPLLALTVTPPKGDKAASVCLDVLAEPPSPAQLWSLDPSSGALTGYAGTLWQKEFAAALKAGLCTVAIDREGTGHKQAAYVCETCAEDRRQRRSRRRKVRTLHKLDTTRGATGKGKLKKERKRGGSSSSDDSSSDDSDEEEEEAVPGDSGSSYGSGDEGFTEPVMCDSCARACHNGHKLRRLPKARRFTCECVRSRGSRRRCLCLGEEEFKVLVENRDSLIESLQRRADRVRGSPDKEVMAAVLNPPETPEQATARLYRAYAPSNVRVRVFRNDGRGDPKDSHVVTARTLEELMDDATKRLGLPSAVRKLYAEDGAEITDLRALAPTGDGRDTPNAFASCGERFCDPRDIDEIKRLKAEIDRESARLRQSDDGDSRDLSEAAKKERDAAEQSLSELKDRLEELTVKTKRPPSRGGVHPLSGRRISAGAAAALQEAPPAVVRLVVRDVEKPDASTVIAAKSINAFMDDAARRLNMGSAVRSIYTPEGYRLRTFADLQELSKDSVVWVSARKTLATE